MYTSILVALDGSAFSASALPVAAALARRCGATLHLVAVFDPSALLHFAPAEAAIPLFDNSLADARSAQLGAWLHELAASVGNTGISVQATLLEGTVVEALAEQTVAIGAELVMMTTHGRGGLDRLRLGSVASSFLARSPVPVFLVRPTGKGAPSPGHELPMGRLVVTLDGSHFSEAVLPHAGRFAAAAGLSLELVRVVEPVANPFALFGADASVVEDYVSGDEETAARLYLEQQALRLGAETTPTVTVLSDNSPARALLNHLVQSSPAAVAIATHGRSGLSRLLFGSVADKILQGVEQPVLVYRPPDPGPATEADRSIATF